MVWSHNDNVYHYLKVFITNKKGLCNALDFSVGWNRLSFFLKTLFFSHPNSAALLEPVSNCSPNTQNARAKC